MEAKRGLAINLPLSTRNIPLLTTKRLSPTRYMRFRSTTPPCCYTTLGSADRLKGAAKLGRTRHLSDGDVQEPRSITNLINRQQPLLKRVSNLYTGVKRLSSRVLLCAGKHMSSSATAREPQGNRAYHDFTDMVHVHLASISVGALPVVGLFFHQSKLFQVYLHLFALSGL